MAGRTLALVPLNDDYQSNALCELDPDTGLLVLRFRVRVRVRVRVRASGALGPHPSAAPRCSARGGLP